MPANSFAAIRPTEGRIIQATQSRGESCQANSFAAIRPTEGRIMPGEFIRRYSPDGGANHAGEFIRRYSPGGRHTMTPERRRPHNRTYEACLAP
jgi:hypothetical protein